MTNVQKDFEKPFFKEYIEMCQEIEKIPAHPQQTAVIIRFHEFYNMLQNEIEYQKRKKETIFSLCKSTIERRTAKYEELKKKLEIRTGYLDYFMEKRYEMQERWDRCIGVLREISKKAPHGDQAQELYIEWCDYYQAIYDATLKVKK